MRLPSFVLGAVIVLAVIGAFVVLGGPGTARSDERDQNRYAELRKVARWLKCRNLGEDLPQELVPDPGTRCSISITDDLLSDDVTGDMYAYDRVDAKNFQICAIFDNAERLARLQSMEWFDPATGCLTGAVRN